MLIVLFNPTHHVAVAFARSAGGAVERIEEG
jgi:hypothetical protein